MRGSFAEHSSETGEKPNLSTITSTPAGSYTQPDGSQKKRAILLRGVRSESRIAVYHHRVFFYGDLESFRVISAVIALVGHHPV